MHPSRNSTFLNKFIQLRIQLKNIFNHQKNAEYQIISQTDNRWTHIQNTHMCKYLYNLLLFVLWSLNTFNIRYLSILKNCESVTLIFTKVILLQNITHHCCLPCWLISLRSWNIYICMFLLFPLNHTNPTQVTHRSHSWSART